MFDKSILTNGYIKDDGTIGTSNIEWAISDFISVTSGENYTYQGLTNIGLAPHSAYYDKNKNFVSSFKQQTGVNTITIPSDIYYVRFTVRTSVSDEDTFMLEKGSTASTYEAYTGYTKQINLPSGMELCKIGTYEDEILKGTGKNLFDKNNWIKAGWGQTIDVSTYTSQSSANKVANGTPIKVVGGAYYTLSWVNPSGVTIENFNLYCYDKNGILKYAHRVSGDNIINGVARQIENDVVYINISSYGDLTDTQLQGIADTLQLEQSTVVTDYEPYGYKDKWYLKKRTGKKVLNGSETWTLASNDTNTTRLYSAISDIIDGATDTTPSNLICSHFVVKTFNYIYNNDVMAISQYGGTNDSLRKRIYLRVDNNIATTAANFQTWLSTHNTTLYYVLATPTYTLLNDTLQATLDSFTSKAGQTNISQVNNDMPFVIKASALLDANTYIEQLEAQVEALS